jgi:stage II sporulation protein AA (anti-sigma F factor antagonist)
MDLQYRITEEELVVDMPRELDHHVAQKLSRQVDFLIDSWHIRTLVFDFADTEFMDSSGIGVMIGRKKTMELHSGEMIARNLGERVTKIFEKSGLLRMIRVEETGKEKNNDRS